MKRVNSWTRAAEIVAHAKRQVKTVTDDCAKRADGEEMLSLIRRYKENHVIFALAELDDCPNPERVRAAVRAPTTPYPDYRLSFSCSECARDVEEVVELLPTEGRVDRGDGPVRLCLKCLLDALQLLDT